MKYKSKLLLGVLIGIIIYLAGVVRIQFIYGEEQFYNPFKDIGAIIVLVGYVIVIIVMIIKEKTTER